MKFSVGGFAVVLAGALTLVAAAPAAAGEPVVARSDVIRAGFDEFGTLTALAGPDGVDLIDVVTPSFYGGPLGAGGAAWRPVGLGAEVVSMANEGDSTVKTVVRALDVGAAWSLCECTIESTYRAEGPALWVSHTLRNARTDRFPYPASPQELPALYSAFPAHRLFTYDGSQPWTGGALTEITTPWPLFSGGGPTWLGTEHWAALVDGFGYGVGIFSPETVRFVGIPGRADRPFGPNGYVAPSAFEVLDHNIVHEYRYALVVGTLAEIRAFASANRPEKEPPDWDFAASREHWWYGNASDEGWPVTGSLRVRLEQPDPWLWSPEGAFRAEDVPHVFVRAAFHGLPPSERGQLFFSRAGDGFWPRGEDHVDVPVVADGLFHTYVFRLALASGYSGWIKRLRYDPVLDGRLGARMELDYVSAQQRSRARMLTFRLHGHLRAVGRVSVPGDLSPDCLASVPLVAERREGDRWKPLAQTLTGRTGGYSVRLPDRPGRYRVRLRESSPGERCLAAASGSLVHRHGR